MLGVVRLGYAAMGHQKPTKNPPRSHNFQNPFYFNFPADYKIIEYPYYTNVNNCLTLILWPKFYFQEYLYCLLYLWM